MFAKALTVTAGLVLASTSAGWAQKAGGTVAKTPGHMSQQSPGGAPGASEFAPGHLKRKGIPSKNASGLTPSHRPGTTTGQSRH